MKTKCSKLVKLHWWKKKKNSFTHPTPVVFLKFPLNLEFAGSTFTVWGYFHWYFLIFSCSFFLLLLSAEIATSITTTAPHSNHNACLVSQQLFVCIHCASDKDILTRPKWWADIPVIEPSCWYLNHVKSRCWTKSTIELQFANYLRHVFGFAVLQFPVLCPQAYTRNTEDLVTPGWSVQKVFRPFHISSHFVKLYAWII